jgi:lysophospholipase L1-like esterase
MKKNYLYLFLILMIFPFNNGFSQKDTVLIDFGQDVLQSDLPWNNLTDTEVSANALLLFNSDIKATPFGVRVNDRFNGVNTGGITTPDALLKIPVSATRDSYYGNVELWNSVTEPTGGIEFSGLDPAKSYTFLIYGSRTATDNRETKYTLEGLTTVSDSINVSNNTANMLEMTITPKADGTINLIASPGGNNDNSYHFYYLNAVKLIYDEESFTQPTISISSPNGGEIYSIGTSQSISWTASDLTEDIIVSYSTNNGSTWIDIDTVASSVTSLDWIIPDYPSSQYLVRAKSWIAEDMSDAVFEVEGVLPNNDTILIDFGAPEAGMPSALPWNNLTDPEVSEDFTTLINSAGDPTAAGIRVYDRFTGKNTGGTTSPNPIIDMPSTVTRDSYFGNVEVFSGFIEPTGGLMFTGLNPSKEYSFIIFASRTATDNREAKYLFDGATMDSVYLNSSNNTSTTVTAMMTPKADGTMNLIVSPGENNNNGNHFYYLGGLKMIYEHEDYTPPRDTILIDFGSSSGLSDLPWNNLTSNDSTGIETPLHNLQVKATPVHISVIDRFTGINTGGTTSPDPLIDIPSSASSDSYFGNVEVFSGAIEPTGALRLSGLNPAKIYKFIIFGSRTASDNRETKYTLDGLSSVSDSINVTNNTAKLVEMEMTPRADGTIDLMASPGMNNNNGNHFYYLNALKLTYDQEDFPQPSITVNSPNGGEVFATGSSQTVSWTAENLTEDIIVSYSDDNGSSWSDIDTLANSETSLNWIVPEFPSTQYLVRVSSWLASDVSDAVFDVQGVLPDNDTILIDFSSGSTNLSPDPWNNLTDWNVGAKVSQMKNSKNLQTTMGIEVTDRFSGTNQNGTTTPQGALKMPSSATRDSHFGNIEEWSGAIEPTGAYRFSGFNKDKEYTFILFASRMGVTDVRETKYKFTGSQVDSVYLSASNNESQTVSITVMPKEDGTFDLDLSPGEGNTNAYHFYYMTALKIVYEQEDPIPPSIMVESPNGGEDWFVGTDHDITWSGINLTADIDVSFSTDNGSNWESITSVPSTESAVTWTVPDNVSTECLVKLVSGDVEDMSDASFTISTNTEPAIKLNHPNGGEQFVSGSTQEITWTPNLLTEDIVVKYSTDNGSTWVTIGTVASDATSISWTLPDVVSSQCLVMVESGAYSDTSNATFSITEKVCSNTIVVLGSSTGAGTGASPIDSAWVWRYRAALDAINPDYEVVNLSVGGYNTFKIVPTGTVFEPGIAETIDVNKNITKAITYSPFAVIVNMPSNDAAKYYTEEQTLENLKLVSDYGKANGVGVWIATTQPRNFTDPDQVNIQKALSISIPEIYQDYSIDFWNGIADTDGWILSAYNSGDGVHLNNAGHRILFEKVMEKQIHLQACLATGLSKPFISTTEVNVYPNPASSQFTVTYSTASQANVEIKFFDLTGREIGNRMIDAVSQGSHSTTYSCSEFSENASLIIGTIQISDSRGMSSSVFKVVLQPQK